ncbi:MAG: hypothetical protein GF365_00910 [Candidatus Buchananbacteria bacterium]|nr:hypothetical protein [Candidatus Buchananbacteria bacterium]
MKKISLIISLFILAMAISGCQSKPTVLGPEKAQARALDFINENLVAPGNEVEIKDVIDDGSVYKMTAVLNDGNELDIFLTKDGKTFFPEGMNIEEISAKNNNNSNDSTNQPAAEIPKTDKPNVELFVMSHCPYGTQIEKGILPVIDLLGDKIDFELKFCDYAMHGQEELNEQLNQYCIQKEQNNKLQAYLQCFLEAGEGEACLKQVGIDQSQLKNCVAQTDQEYKVTANFENKQGWKGNYPPFNVYQQDNAQYGVQGSPTLMVNGVKASSARDAQSLLTTICSGFNAAPEECSQQLDATPPAPGFGFEGSGSANANAGCAN